MAKSKGASAQSSTSSKSRSAASGSSARSRFEERTDEHASYVRRYYPVFESLILFIMDAPKWWRAFRSYIRDELDYRTELLLQTILYFVLGTVGVAFSGFWLCLGTFFVLRDLTGSAAIASFAVFGLFFVLGALLLFFMLKVGGKIFDARKDRAFEDEEDDF